MKSKVQTKRQPVLLALTASALLTLLIIVGSRNLEHYDAALFGYTVASVVAFGAVVFRYAIWLQRPATRIYWRRGWKLFRDRKNLLANTSSAAKTIVGGMAIQKFIFRRGVSRWLMHQLIMWGCVISALVTFPLVFGWVHFELEGDRGYRAYVFGFPLNVVDGRSLIAWVTFHALDFTAIMVLAGCALAIHRRLHDPVAIALQQFLLDFVPHLLLIAICITGLILTSSSLWLHGYMYSFIALSHQAVVIMTLFYLPFGKLFHVIQRPHLSAWNSIKGAHGNAAGSLSTLRVSLWPKCGGISKQSSTNLALITLGDGHVWQDYCPRCKRVIRGLAYASLPQQEAQVFQGSRVEGGHKS